MKPVKEEKRNDSINGIQRLKEKWSELSFFDRFEHVIMLIVSFILGIIILLALFRLIENVYYLFISQMTDRTEFTAFQITFGMLLTLLITFEFRNSINAVIEGKGLLIQVKIVILIAIIALARKFLVIDPKEYGAEILAAYGFIALCLGLTYWLLCKKDLQDDDLRSRL